MVELTAFRYQTAEGPLHRLDVRFKLALLVILSMASVNSTPQELMAAAGCLLTLTLTCRLPVISAAKEIRFFLVFLVIVVLTRSLSTAGAPLVDLKIATITRPGLISGVETAGRLLLVVWLGWLLVATTCTSRIKAAVQWLLKPVPFIPEQRVAVMIGLVVRFIPVVFDQYHMIALAQRARGLGNRKNPLVRLRHIVLPLLRRVFESADQLTIAMQARCYNEDRLDPTLTAGRRDWFCLSLVLALIIAARFVRQ